MAVQLKDIAAHLNVSVSTVSRVLNGTGRVGPKTRERILAAIEEFGYQPNEVARSLQRRSSNTIGIIVPDLSNNFYSKVIKGVELVARRHEHTVIVCNSDENIEREEEYLQILLQKQVKGLILATVGGDPGMLKPYRANGIPFVFIDNLPDGHEQYSTISIDNYKASYDLASHMAAEGHREFAILTGPLVQSTSHQRMEGFRQGLADHGISLDERWIGVGDFTRESGYRIMKQWLGEEKRPTALLAANNFLLYGAAQALREHGLRIPGHMAVACFDVQDETGLQQPQITSIVQPAARIGELAADIIIGSDEIRQIILEPELQIHESSLRRG